MQSIGGRLAFFALFVVLGGPSYAGNEALTGLWRPEARTEFFGLAATPAKSPAGTPTPPLKGEYLERYNEKAKQPRDVDRGATPDSRNGAFQPKFDCLAPTMPQMMLGDLEIIVTDSVVYVLHGGAARLIFTDGIGHPEIHTDPDVAPRLGEHIPNNLGHSIGHWEGRSLIVDTVGLLENRIDASAEHSDALHIMERMTLVDANVLEDQITLEDPMALSSPWRSTVRYRRDALTNSSGEPPVCRSDAHGP